MFTFEGLGKLDRFLISVGVVVVLPDRVVEAEVDVPVVLDVLVQVSDEDSLTRWEAGRGGREWEGGHTVQLSGATEGALTQRMMVPTLLHIILTLKVSAFLL